MSTIHEVVPGRSIGAFALGMTRQEIEDLGISPMNYKKGDDSIFFPLIELTEAEPSRFKHRPYPGLTVEFDEQGRCCRISAVFLYEPDPPIFALRGKVLNGMTLQAAKDLVGTMASDARVSYGVVESRSTGVSVGVFERGDPYIMSVSVEPVQGTAP